MIAAILAGAALIAIGVPLGFALTRRLLFAVVSGPLVSALLATVAIVAMLVVGGSLWIWLAVVFALQIVLTVLLLRRHGEPTEHASAADMCWLTAPLLPPALLVIAPPIGWDAHSIWWLHAGYFARGGAAARQAMSEPALQFSHPDYPPLPSAPLAAVWQVFPAADFHVAQTVSAMMAFSAIVILAFAVRRVLGQARPALARLAGVLVALATWATAPDLVMAGYSDALWSAAFVAGALPLLLGRVAGPVEVGMLTVAALSKNEGFIAVTALAVLLTLRLRPRRRLWMPWLPVAAGVSWAAFSRAVGATSYLQAGGRFQDLLALNPEVWDRLPAILTALRAVAGDVVAIAFVVAVLGVLALRRQRRSLGLGSDLWLWCLTAAYAGSLILAYLISPMDITWQLSTSVSRVGLPLVLLTCASCAIWAVVAVSRTSAASDSGASAEGASPPLAPAGR